MSEVNNTFDRFTEKVEADPDLAWGTRFLFLCALMIGVFAGAGAVFGAFMLERFWR